MLKRLLDPIYGLIQSLFNYGVVTAVNNDGPHQLLQVKVLGLLLDDVPLAEAQGYTGIAGVGSTVFLMSLGGDRSSPVAVVVTNGKGRPTGWASTDCGMYDNEGQVIHIGRNGIRVTGPKGLVLDCNVEITGNTSIAGDTGMAGNASVGGDATINGTSTASDHVSSGKSGKDHTHVETGTNTNPPT